MQHRLSSREKAVITEPVAYSVVIPTFNGSATIERCLRSVLRQDLRKRYEVIVIDSSSDDTPQIIRRLFPQVRLTHLEQQTPEGTARNVGIAAARGEIIAMTDQDCVVEPGWLARIDRVMADSDCDAVGGSIVPFGGDDFFARISFLVEFSEFLPRAGISLKSSSPTCNIAYRKRVFDDNSGYPGDFPVSEDLVFNYRLARGGAKMLFDPDIRVRHINRQGLRSALSHQYYLGAGSARARKICSDLPGAFLRDFPLLLPGLPLYRWVAVLTRLARNSGLSRRQLFLYSVPVGVTVVPWFAGFLRETLRQETAAEEDRG